MFSSPGRCEWSSESSRVAALKRLWKCVSRWEVLGTASFPTNAFPILFQSARESENEIWITAQELKITKSWSSMHFLYLKSLYALLLRDVKSPIIALIREILTGIISTHHARNKAHVPPSCQQSLQKAQQQTCSPLALPIEIRGMLQAHRRKWLLITIITQQGRYSRCILVSKATRQTEDAASQFSPTWASQAGVVKLGIKPVNEKQNFKRLSPDVIPQTCSRFCTGILH